MKPIQKDELYEHLSQFLKAKGIEMKDGSYPRGIQAGCSLLADAINLSQKGHQAGEGRDRQEPGADAAGDPREDGPQTGGEGWRQRQGRPQPEARGPAAEAHVGKTLDRKLKLGGRGFPGLLGRGASVTCLSILDLHKSRFGMDCWFGRGLCIGMPLWLGWSGRVAVG